MEQSIKGMLLPGLATVALSAVAWLLLQDGMASLQEMRQLERTPPSYVGAILPGQVQSSGWVEADKTLESPLTSLQCVYYRYLHQVESRDSDGNTTWNVASQSVAT